MRPYYYDFPVLQRLQQTKSLGRQHLRREIWLRPHFQSTWFCASIRAFVCIGQFNDDRLLDRQQPDRERSMTLCLHKLRLDWCVLMHVCWHPAARSFWWCGSSSRELAGCALKYSAALSQKKALLLCPKRRLFITWSTDLCVQIILFFLCLDEFLLHDSLDRACRCCAARLIDIARRHVTHRLNLYCSFWNGVRSDRKAL